MRVQHLSVRVPVLLALVLLVACSAPAAPSQALAPTAAPPTTPPTPTVEPKPSLVIDADMGSGDIMAILYLLQHPKVDVTAITVAGTGEAHCEPGLRHALGLIALADAGTIPVACGREVPLAGDKKFPTLVRDYADGDMGIAWPQVETPATQSAAELLRSTIGAASQKSILLTLGPLTNIAEALEAEPALAEQLEMVYIVGGAFGVPGNIVDLVPISDNQTAEFNIYIDPHAVRTVLESGVPITFIPLDASESAPLVWPFSFYKTLEANQGTPAATAAFDLFEADPALRQEGPFFQHALAAVTVAGEQLATIEDTAVAVVDAEGDEWGRTQEVADGRAVRVAGAADADQVAQHFLSGLNNGGAIATTVEITPPIVVTFTEQGCEATGPQSVPAGAIPIEWRVEDSRFELFALVVGTLDEGKTLADLEDWPFMAEPPWFNYITNDEAVPNSRQLFVVEAQEGPLYMGCLARPPETKTGAVGPIEIAP